MVPCVVSYRNSTSNHNIASIGFFSSAVVSYRNSTSNHNSFGDFHHFRFVVSYRNSTSNHNILILRSVSIMLYLIEILHQTTTIRNIYQIGKSCILSKFYIKPQQKFSPSEIVERCILAKFYIKPQR